MSAVCVIAETEMTCTRLDKKGIRNASPRTPRVTRTGISSEGLLIGLSVAKRIIDE